MDEFKLKSIEEFDDLFFEEIKSKKEAKPEPVQVKESLIPEISTEPEDIPAEDYAAEPVQTETPAEDVPLYVAPSMNEENRTDAKGEPKAKKSAGALAGKIVAIVLLVFTVLTFLFGCFVSVFLDEDSSLGGYTFSTLSTDVDSLELSKGDLIIAKKGEQYEIGKPTAFASRTGKGCDVLTVVYAEYYGTDTQLTVSNPADGSQNVESASNCRGEVQFYIPFIAGLVSFAMTNAILVCVLFVLLTALWCLIIILIEKSEAKKRQNEAE